LETDKILVPPDNADSAKSVIVMKNTFSDHGNEIDEIISSKLPRIVRWGTVYFFFMLLLIGIICWFIEYPDIVVASAKLNSINAAKEIITKTDGKIVKILVKENEKVAAGQILGYMESTAKPQSVLQIHSQVDSMITLIEENKTDEIIKYFPTSTYSFEKGKENILGELQSSYQAFIQAFILFKDYLSKGFFFKKKRMLLTDMQNIVKLHGILIDQKKLMQKDLSLSNETFNANESLAKDKVISSFDYRNEESKLIAKQLSLPQINASIVSNESLQNEKKKEINELENQIIVEKNTFIQALLTMKSQIQGWETKYLLKAPVSGTVSFSGFFQENQEMKAGQPLFYVQPVNTSCFVEMLVSQYNFGKVKQGQEVLLKFQAYPSEQYGSVVGKIDYINTIPTDSGYLAKVILPNGLITNFKNPLLYRNGLVAQADIITEKMRLLERFYYNIAKQFKR